MLIWVVDVLCNNIKIIVPAMLKMSYCIVKSLDSAPDKRGKQILLPGLFVPHTLIILTNKGPKKLELQNFPEIMILIKRVKNSGVLFIRIKYSVNVRIQALNHLPDMPRMR